MRGNICDECDITTYQGCFSLKRKFREFEFNRTNYICTFSVEIRINRIKITANLYRISVRKDKGMVVSRTRNAVDCISFARDCDFKSDVYEDGAS